MASACARERLKARACWFAKDVDKRGRTTEQFTHTNDPPPHHQRGTPYVYVCKVTLQYEGKE